ncbi:bifunctional precorrin-2 dehydrogenase/sirohydrochlorin ferrochelatase [Halalkaliarchaeum sp. AArc-GB]|uniref:precorrin-2 dehydrogenase/sirohydrochlorin ferrochelatase family protein n=1 Tax=Halalkaliarchaeum sp. AArc-GB TaxID=3074078 RepID=UPI0028638497|nr:bifunctional precorrin-2 dehydrogenase/sirohydrochlorin ferrochelatase [Halalkaliarchaeum sp. AArc-GB]MDR5673748.1 bifunctional precorrin-2 dehydrogenase/sirohydrochlorin ferrochelatase [Halalkaliarchaeum sp. AArc-GB]
MLPLFHDFEGRSVVIVGGGRVALRKARTFATEADVTVVADAFVDGLDEVDCERRRRRLEPDEADELLASVEGDLFLVIPATDDRTLNDAIARAGRKAGALVNRVDERGDTVTPARAESGPLTVAISTGGKSPAVARHLRREIEPLLDRTEPMVGLQADLRDRLDDDPDLSAKQRRQALRRIIDDDGVWRALEDGRYDDARGRALEAAEIASTE